MIRGIIFVCCISFACLAVVSGETALYIKGVRAEWNPTSVIHETEVADLSAHLIKTIPLHNFINRENFPEISLNGHPQATVLTVMEAVTEKEASHMKFFAEENSFKKLEIATENPDLDPICRTTTLLSGELPESHRIVGHSWIDGTTAQTVKAFTYKGHSQVWRVADAVAQASNGNALTLAISADSALAGALALHNDLHDTHPTWNTEAFYYDNYASIGKSLFGIAGLIEFKDVVAYHAELEKAYPGMFSLHKNADTIFIAEMAMLRKLPSKVKIMHRENTGASDLISVGISSVLSLKNVYGTISKQVSVALEVIDNELQQLEKELNLFYGSNIIEEVAVLGGSTTIYTAESPFKHVALRNILSVEAEGDEDPDNDTTYYTFAQVSSYQSCVWAGVIMLVSLVWASCFMYCMETGTDTLLFRGLGGKPHIQ